MKILTVAIPNHHFFQWVNQLEGAGHQVFWFDVTDGGPPSDKISWVTQIKGWKLKWDFPMRSGVKRRFPKLYNRIQKWNEHTVEYAFAKAFKEIQPDIVHCFEMQLAGLPILPVMQKTEVPLIYSSWGSDLFDFNRLGVSKVEVTEFLKRADYLITDCKRDAKIAESNGFAGMFLGVFPGNGGIRIPQEAVLASSKRDTVLIKGYEDGVGKASVILKALEMVPDDLLKGHAIVVYSTDTVIEEQIKSSPVLSDLEMIVHSRYTFIPNEELLRLMGKSHIHIANSLSDGMPNALLEAMGMGAFPIQSNPGRVTEEVVTDGKNGFLIKNPLDVNEIAMQIENALQQDELRVQAQDYNTHFINTHYNRSTLQPSIQELYENVYLKHHR